MNNLMHIQSYLNGKSQKAVETAVAQKVISFDKNRYRLCKTDKTISTYIAEFTTSYLAEMQEILGDGEFSKNVFIKLDSILMEGFKPSGKEIINIYTDTNDAVKECSKQDVTVYHFEKDEQQREVLTCKGELVKGSLTMALRKSDHIESGSENIVSRRQYVMDLFGVDASVGSFVTGRLKDYDDDKYDAHIVALLDSASYFINNLPRRMDALIGYKKLLFSDSRNTVRNTIYSIIGSNEEIVDLLIPLFYRGYRDCVNFTRDLVVAAMRQKLQEILDNEDIDEYRDFVNTSGDISMLAEITGMEKETLNFIIQFGNFDDFKFYMSVHVNINGEVNNTKKLDDDVVDGLYKTIKDNEISAPISYNYVKQMLNAIQNSSIDKKNKEKLVNQFIKECSILYDFDTQVISRVLSDRRCNRQLKFDIAMMLISHQNFVDVMEKHPAIIDINTTEVSNEVLACKSYEEIKNHLERRYGKVEINNNSVTINSRIYGIDMVKKVELSDEAKIHYADKVKKSEFSTKCIEFAEIIIEMGISSDVEKNGISAKIRKKEKSCTITFTDGIYTKDKVLSHSDFIKYQANCKIAGVAKKVNALYKTVLNIKDNSEILSFFRMLPPMYNYEKISPDDAVMAMINDTNLNLKLASNESGMPDSLMDEAGYYVGIPEITKLVEIARTAYCEAYQYEGMLQNKQGMSFESLFKPVVYSINSKKLIPFADAIGNGDGEVYIGIDKVLTSENIKHLQELKAENKTKSRAVLDKFVAIGTDDSSWEQRIEFIEKHINDMDVCREELFVMIHSLSLDEAGMDWLKSVLEGIDDNIIKDLIEFEKNSTNRNFCIINLK